jgi:uncharacterized membrane-anchored protein
LIEAGVKAVINAGKTMSGRIMTKGPLMLLQSEIPVLEINPLWFPFFQDGMSIELNESGISFEHIVIPCTLFTRSRWSQLYEQAAGCFHERLAGFIDNSLYYADKERSFILSPFPCPRLRTKLEGSHVVVVSRGNGYREDLDTIRAYIKRNRPVLVAVDGGADALLGNGFVPDLIIGDMDSVTDAALRCGAEIIVHSYSDGRSPGLERVRSLGLTCETLSAPGTSEDIALLLAYEMKAEWIVSIGAHSHMNEFLEKGRAGMGSTLLVRMKIGGKLIDMKGIHYLQSREKRGLFQRFGRSSLWEWTGWGAAVILAAAFVFSRQSSGVAEAWMSLRTMLP